MSNHIQEPQLKGRPFEGFLKKGWSNKASMTSKQAKKDFERQAELFQMPPEKVRDKLVESYQIEINEVEQYVRSLRKIATYHEKILNKIKKDQRIAKNVKF